MSQGDPRPWMQDGAPDALRDVLESARLDEPTIDQLAGLKAKLGPLIATPPPAAPAAGSGAGGAGVAGGAGLAKTVLIASVASAVVGGGSFFAGRAYERASEEDPPIAVAAPETSPVSPNAEAGVEAAPSTLGLEAVVEAGPSSRLEAQAVPKPKQITEAAPPPRTRPPVTKPKEPTGDEEVALLEEAMGALQSQRASLALAHVQDHAKRFPEGVLAQEREVIAIDALLALGRREEAEKRVATFRQKWPTSSHLLRIDALLAR